MESIKKKTIILLNAPHNTGRGKITSILETFYDFKRYSVWGEFKSRVHSLYGLGYLPENHYDSTYTKKIPDFYGLSPYEAYKKVYREYVIPNHGHSFLLDDLIDRIDNDPHENIIIPDISTNLEASYFFNYYGQQTLLFKVMKKGSDWDKGMNGHYVDDKYAFVQIRGGKKRKQCAIINNRGNYVDLLKDITYYYKAFYEKEMKYNAK